MNISGIPPIQLNSLSAYQQVRPSHDGSPTLPVSEGEDTVTLSAEAMQQAAGAYPDAVSAAVADLQGDQKAMATDFRTIGDYFAAHGGFEAQDAFMRNNFTQEQLRAFPPPTEGFIHPPGATAQPVPESLSASVADLKLGKTNMAEDLRAIGDYFRDHGGREAHRAFMKATFSEAERASIREFREAAAASSNGAESRTEGSTGPA